MSSDAEKVAVTLNPLIAAYQGYVDIYKKFRRAVLTNGHVSIQLCDMLNNDLSNQLAIINKAKDVAHTEILRAKK